MNARFLVLGLAVTFSLCDRVHSQPDELITLKDQFLEARKQSADVPLASKLSQLKSGYEKALERAIAESRDKGDLDTVVSLRNELERIVAEEDERQTYDSDSANALVETYFAHIEKIYQEDQKARLKLASKLRDALEALQERLTKQDRIEDALEIQSFSKSNELVDLIVGDSGGTPNFDYYSAIFEIADVEESMDTSASDSTSSVTTRIVIIPETEGLPAPPTFELIDSLNLSDIAFIGRSVFPNVGMIRNDGALVWLKSDATQPVIFEGDHSFCIQGSLLPFIGLKTDGTLTVADEGDPSVTALLRSLTDVTSLMTTTGIAAAVKSDGTVSISGSNSARLSSVGSFDDVKQVNFAGASSVSVLHKDGSVTDFINQVMNEPSTDGDIVELYRYSVGLNDRGKVVGWGGGNQTHLEEAGRSPRHVILDENAFAAIKSDGSFVAMSRNANAEWEHLSDIEVALEGALSASWLIRRENRWILAVLPADTVPRSGIWDAQELIEARATYQP